MLNLFITFSNKLLRVYKCNVIRCLLVYTKTFFSNALGVSYALEW